MRAFILIFLCMFVLPLFVSAEVVDPIRSAIDSYRNADDLFRQDRNDRERREQREFQNRLMIEQNRREQARHDAEMERYRKQRIQDEEALRKEARLLQAELVKRRQENEWSQAIIKFSSSHPEYLTPGGLSENMLSELSLLAPIRSLDTLDAKLNVLEEARKKIEAAAVVTAENKIVWDQFILTHPAFADSNSKYRKYGDYLFENKFNEKISFGAVTYIQALNLVAEETYAVLGMPNEEARITQSKRRKSK